MKWWWCIPFIFLSSFGSVAQQDANALRRTFLDPSSSVVMVAAHRASHKLYPENSLGAIEESIRSGVDIVELDVKVSMDGIPFLMHDRTLDRTTNGTGDPEQFTWQELQQLKIVDKGIQTTFNIPSLEEALETTRGKILVDLDLKTDRIDEVIDIVEKTGVKDFVFFFDSDYHVLSRVRAADSEYMIMPRAHTVAEADSAIVLFDPPVVHIDFSFYGPECVKTISMSSARIWINALGDCDRNFKRGRGKRAIRKLLEHGANVIQTDEPNLLLAALRDEGLHP
jgi:glycerophosphoryl diester phosphodiesterase